MRNRLKELRARDGFNQTQLAKQAGISRQTVSLIERNDFMPSILTAVKIARIFNEPVENVFIFEEEIYESKTLSSITCTWWHYWWFCGFFHGKY